MRRTSILSIVILSLLGFGLAAKAEPNVNASKTDVLTNDVDGDNLADPGDKITYTVIISNFPADDNATDVAFSDTVDANSTLVAGSVKGTPLALDDNYNFTVDTLLSVPAPGVLINDGDLDGLVTAIPIVGGSSFFGGDVDLAADGSFTYDPPTGFEGFDLFVYTIEDTDTIPNTDSAEVFLFVSNGLLRRSVLPKYAALPVASANMEAARGLPGTVSLNIGTLPRGKSITITFDVTVIALIEATELCNQGTVSGTNFPDELTDDPTDGELDNPTCTALDDSDCPDADSDDIEACECPTDSVRGGETCECTGDRGGCDCDDNDPNNFPGNTETCDGQDNDCDTEIDEGLGTTTCGTGECEVTVNNCEGGVPQTCTPGTPTGESCDGLDNDCDGDTDEDLGTTTCGTGECQRTVDNCDGGVPQTCTPGTPTGELCDGLDNDCDGSTDEGGVCVLAVFVDIKPGSCPNSFNRNSHGVLPVAVLGTAAFDASQVDVSSVALSRADGVGGSVSPHEGPPGPHSVLDDVATPFPGVPCNCHGLTGDGITDLSMKFKTDELVAALELDTLPAGALVEMVVTGSLLDGTPFEGSDCVRLVPPGSPPGLLAVLQPGITEAYVEVSPLDDQLDSGGFGNFERSFPQSTVSTLDAANAAGEKKFVGWKLDGAFESTDFTFGVTVEGMSQTIEAVYRLPGDIIADDVVNLVDFAQFANCFGANAGTASCAAEFHAASDLNRDGSVNLVDFSIFALNFGT